MVVELKHGGYQVSYVPEKGMNFISLRRGDKEVIAQDTKQLFEQRYAGLGAMIGPHFHARNPDVIPPVPDESKFPHLAYCKGKDPFSHGVGRYAPWRVLSQTNAQLVCELSGDDLFNGIPLRQLEGQNFKMNYTATLTDDGLCIELSVVADTASIVGLHTYYALENGKGRVTAQVQDQYNDMGMFKPIPSTWNYQDHTLTFDMPQTADYGFLPYPDLQHGAILLETGSRKVTVQYWSDNAENAWQLWHPENGTFVCIEPVSAKNPRNYHLSISKIKILISVD